MKENLKKMTGISSLRFLLMIGIVGLLCLIPCVLAEDLMAAFAPVPITGPAPLNVSFVDQSEGAPSVWKWDLDGDGGWDSYEQNPNHTYTTPGTYVVNLSVSNSTSVSDNYTLRDITVLDPVLNPLFAAAPRTGYAPLNVSFIDQSTGARSWNWTFGDNFTSTDKERTSQNTLHTYTTPGWYSVNLTISDNSTFAKGKTKDLVHDNFVHVLPVPPPFADFTATPQSGTANLTVSFVDQTPGTDNLTYFWDFGDHSVGSHDRNPVHEYTSEGSFNVSVDVTGTGGTTNILKKGYISVGTPPVPQADFAVSPAVGTAPLDVSFIGLANGSGNLVYEWDFGDNTPHVYGRNPNHTYTSADSYRVVLNVTDGTRIGSTTRNPGVIVNEAPAPVIAFTGSPTTGNRPLNVSFSDFSTGLNASPAYLWWFGDGSTSTDHLPVHMYNTTGTFDVCLTVISDGVSYQQTNRDFMYISDATRTSAMFTATPRNGTAPLDVSFIDQSSGDKPLSYEWYFGDDSVVEYSQNPTHQYTVPGVYNVSLLVSGSSGNDMLRFNQYITVLTPSLPSSGFTATPLYGSAPLNVSFIDQSTGAAPLTYAWNFGDGSAVSYEKNPVHRYEESGNFTVNLTVTNADGSAKTVQENYVQVGTPLKSHALFTATPRNGTAPLEVSFIDQSSAEEVTDYQWDFGDDSLISHEQNPVHRYSEPGLYNVTLGITNANNFTDINHQTGFIEVRTPALQKVDFAASPSKGASPLTVSFIDQTSGEGPYTYLWEFGDDSDKSYQKNPSHTYSNPGLYSVNLTVSGPVGTAQAVRENMINVTSGSSLSSSLDFTAIPSYGNPPLQMNFVDQSYGISNYTYNWTFGDGSGSSARNPSVIYHNEGDYEVRLNVSGSNLPDAVKTVPVHQINGSFDYLVSGSGPYVVNLTDTSVGYPSSWYWTIRNQVRNALVFSSNEQNTSAVIKKSGQYSIILTTWNDRFKSTRKQSLTL